MFARARVVVPHWTCAKRLTHSVAGVPGVVFDACVPTVRQSVGLKGWAPSYTGGGGAFQCAEVEAPPPPIINLLEPPRTFGSSPALQLIASAPPFHGKLLSHKEVSHT